ncbi:MAG: hypothetical protein QGI78_05800 [Phycisphaerales bacterium]|jgi:hypothetical protein|nr:hypothetical protein [Phycisphaerales bacterium]
MKNLYLLLALSLLSTTPAGAYFPSEEDNIFAWADAVTETEDRGASILMIPMRGQTLTDIRGEIYEELIDEIADLNPDLIVVDIDCKDAHDVFYQQMGWLNPKEIGKFEGETKNLPAVAKVFRVHLKEIPQVVFIKDAMGAISPLALSWEKAYMTPTARLTGTMELASRYAGISDENVRGKMRTAWTLLGSILGGYGKRDPDLMLALVDPEKVLSGTWNGRKVDWFNHLEADFLVDGSPDMVPGFSATIAEELGISEATVDSLSDVLLLNDIREYHFVGEEITKKLTDYVKNWRSNLAKAQELWGDYQQESRWATGANAKRWLVKNRNTIKMLIGICKKYPAVRIRMGFDKQLRGLNAILEEIERELRKPSAPGRDGGGPSMGGGGGGMTR